MGLSGSEPAPRPRAPRAILACLLVLLTAGIVRAGYPEGIAAYKKSDWTTALAELDPLAAGGHADAQFYLAYMYETGKGVDVDLARAAELYRASAEQGNEKAQFNLGAAYEAGRGVAVDPAEAHRWYLAAADQGFLRAQYKVAELYESGTGVEADLIQAYKWFALAGKPRYLDARKRRKRVADKMDLFEIAEADLQVRLWRAEHTD